VRGRNKDVRENRGRGARRMTGGYTTPGTLKMLPRFSIGKNVQEEEMGL